ncbi:MAG: flavodoxin-dependent (E)-4-hydroxy-3-methylbut-2-enyl-diphosphate synthase [Candidatus Aminicenantes bacterium]|nr:flavodoxin-dependent (E)-4-hydroxy-3-methylbut-2-enyl-diphosphate synthase [Candidatus Aminicenantes bacterium]
MAVLIPLGPRRSARRVHVGSVAVGGGAPVSVQSMTKTDTRDAEGTIAQIRSLERAGCEIVRLAVPDEDAVAALGAIRKAVETPLVADIHFDHRLALGALRAGVDGLRLNPGNIGSRSKVEDVVRAAAERKTVIRIGVNSGSLEKDLLAKYGGATAEAMVESALRHVSILEALGHEELKISLKASDVGRTLEAYRLMASKVPYPFHAGITEAGGLQSGAIKSAVGLSLLLREGLADTIRVSLTAPPEEEVRTAYRILSSLNLRQRGPEVVSCPTCGRCEVDLIGLSAEVEKRLAGLKTHFVAAVMGCEVNGPGEAREADIGLAFGRDKAVLFRRGEAVKRVAASEALEVFVQEAYALAEEIEKEGR